MHNIIGYTEDTQSLEGILNLLKDEYHFTKKQIASKRLEKYAPEISAVFSRYNRKSTDTTMMVKGPRKSSQTSQNRKTHQENVADIAAQIATKLKMNVEIVRIIAKNHDLRHTFLGHSGEWWLSNIKENDGTGYYVHNALGARDLIYREEIYNKIIDKIQAHNPNISEKRLSQIRNSLWLLIEPINSHNGERGTEFMPVSQKTHRDFEEEILYCHTKKDFDKTIMPATPEGCLMRLSDIISYVPFDMVAGIEEGFIKGLNQEYTQALYRIGISEQELLECAIKGNYDDIAYKMQTIFINDVIANSTQRVITMSPNVARSLKSFRNINNRQIVNFVVLEEDIETYPPALNQLSNTFKDIILENNLLERLSNANLDMNINSELETKYKDTPYMGFIRYICMTTKSDFDFTTKMIDQATRQSVEDELDRARDIVVNSKSFTPDPNFPDRDSRIEMYISYYRQLDEQGKLSKKQYTNANRSQDISNIMESISYGKKKLNFLSFDERIAKEMGLKYLSSLNDREFFDLLLKTKIVTPEQFDSLTRKYKDIDLQKEVHVQEKWKKVSAEQEQSK